MRQKAKECRCWVNYPNKAYKKSSGKWKCIDDYQCITQYDGSKKKTRCILKEKDNDRI